MKLKILIIFVCTLMSSSLFGEDSRSLTDNETRFLGGSFKTIEIKKSYNELGSFLKEKESDINLCQ